MSRKKIKRAKPRRRQPQAKAEAGQRPQLSLVMIAKDEEANMTRVLASAAPWVDEIVLVDTGSSDRTVEIAKSYGARVYHHPWENDFAKHRNQALSYAQGQWCLQLDADEELDQATAPLIRPALNQDRFNGFWLVFRNQLPGGMMSTVLLPRLFRNMPGVTYRQQIHNQINIPGQSTNLGVAVNHYGYNTDPETARRKHARRQGMLQEWLTKEPDNWLPHYYLSQVLYIQTEEAARAGGMAPEQRRDNLARVAGHGLKALELAQAQGVDPGRYTSVYPYAFNGLSLLGDQQRAWEVLHAWERDDPDNPDMAYVVVEQHYAAGRWPQALEWAQRYCRLADGAQAYLADHPSKELFTIGRKNAIMVVWLVAASQLGREDEARQVFRALYQEPNAENAARVAVERLGQLGLGNAATDLARTAGQDQPGWAWPLSHLAGQGGSSGQPWSQPGAFTGAPYPGAGQAG